ncbi:hypothetical protein GE115_16575 [Agromyces sp. CFH 90414]|uniref:FtsK domain-containing protein n=1 Tax=Agromyces agglutinans TaxID=2662258 RepID=A0A6I2FBD8_9MICO|nr:FtsK/SpoIIIE domain-containing protein [Agromyces agglutinans]MRG61474.1 hypothetical protein [Agromyces agglutinans]
MPDPNDDLDLPLALPPAPPDEPRPGFPVLASLAPVAGALALWFVTGSPLSLAFAAFGPIVAVASMLDARRQVAKRLRRARRDRESALAALRDELGGRQARELEHARRLHPSARRALAAPPGALWRPAAPAAVVLGTGRAASGVRVTGTPVDDADRELLALARRLDRAPITVEPGAGIGIVGPRLLARAAARAVVVQLAARCAPGGVGFRFPQDPEWSWAAGLPHGGRDPLVHVIESDEASAARTAADHSDGWLVAVASDAAQLPPGAGTVLRLHSPRDGVLERERGLPAGRRLVPDLVSIEEASAWASAASAAADRAGLAAGAARLPRSVPFETLAQPAPDPAGRGSLAAVVGASAPGADGSVELDLVREGPHALVAGTSGSGKSEFLISWLAALAVAHPPERAAFLLIDFKGGATFEPLRGLPHVAGIVTDLDEAEARRAVESLRAELRHREHVLRAAGAREIAALAPEVALPRLVIVIDEYQAMVDRFPEVGQVIADIAARGRSLGVHLVLAAQRPNGVVREQVTANCGVRVSLRVLDRADSIAVIGTPAAASLDAESPGRAVLATAERRPIEFQAAFTSSGALERIRAAADGAPARRPWLDPLPRVVEPADLAKLVVADAAGVRGTDAEATPADTTAAGRGVVFGVVDEPERQRRSLAQWHPEADGHLLVVGGAGSGRSGALGSVARSFAARHGGDAVVVLGGPRSGEWDRLHEELARVRAAAYSGPRLLVADDLDSRHRAWPEEHRHAVAATLEALLREGRATGLRLAASATSVQALGSGIREGFSSTLLLRHPNRGELVHAGGVGDLWRADEPPGAGQWRGGRVQVVRTGPPPASAERPVAPLRPPSDRPLAVVTDSVVADAAALRPGAGREVVELGANPASARHAAAAVEAGGAPIVVGDGDAWAMNWALLAGIRERGPLVVHGGPAEYRAVVRDRRVPPLLDDGRSQCWLLEAGAAPVRRAWPAAPAVPAGPDRSAHPGLREPPRG